MISFKIDDVVTEYLRLENGNNIWSVVRRLSLAAVTYHIWKERNQRLFRGDKREAKKLFEDICEVVQLKLMNLNVKNSEAVKRVANIWGIHFNRIC